MTKITESQNGLGWMHTSVSPRARIRSLSSPSFNAEELFLYLRRNIYNCRHYKAHRECVGGICKIQRELTTLQGQFEFLTVLTGAVIKLYEQKALEKQTQSKHPADKCRGDAI